MIDCPRCGKKIPLIDHPTKPGRVVAYCTCNKNRAVYESNKPDTPAPKRGAKKGKEV